MQTKRVTELVKNDVFSYLGRQRIVTKVENELIYFCYYVEGKSNGQGAYYFGWKSQQKVEYHYNEQSQVV